MANELRTYRKFTGAVELSLKSESGGRTFMDMRDAKGTTQARYGDGDEDLQQVVDLLGKAGHVYAPSIPDPVPPEDDLTFEQALRQLLAYDMSGSSEARPELPTYLDWANAPQDRNFPPGADMLAGTLWGVLDNIQGFSSQPGRTQILSTEAWLKSGGLWKLAQSDGGKTLAGADYADSYDNSAESGGQRASTAPGGGTSADAISAGHNFHFYPDGARWSWDPRAAQAIIVVVRARLEPGTYTEATAPKYVLCAAADAWKSTTAPYPNNYDMGIGKFKRVERETRMHTMSNGDLSGTLPPVKGDISEMR